MAMTAPDVRTIVVGVPMPAAVCRKESASDWQHRQCFSKQKRTYNNDDYGYDHSHKDEEPDLPSV
jgi:hypothetical protein